MIANIIMTAFFIIVTLALIKLLQLEFKYGAEEIEYLCGDGKACEECKCRQRTTVDIEEHLNSEGRK